MDFEAKVLNSNQSDLNLIQGDLKFKARFRDSKHWRLSPKDLNSIFCIEFKGRF
jgi:hypothetical protein